jgi:hypothetical protein
MSSLFSEVGIFTTPNQRILKPALDTISAPNGDFTNLNAGTLTATTFTVSNLTVATLTATTSITTPILYTITPTCTVIQDASFTAQTTNATPVIGYTYAMPAETVNKVDISVSGITAAGDTLIVKGTIRAKNILGVGSVGTVIDYYYNSDPALAGCSISFAIAGTSLNIRANGIAGQIIRFSGLITITQTVFS